VFLGGYLHVYRELAWVRALTDHLGFELVADEPGSKQPSSLTAHEIRDEAHSIINAKDPTWRRSRSAAGRCGLLGTVLGIGLALAYTGSEVTKLLGPLAVKVWTTVAGLACSILLSASFAMKLTAWVDACEKNLEAWDARRIADREQREKVA